ncbi:MAG: PQQ-binding-like beta-propeller repeat protein [Planctomycetota bacterium]
MEIEDLIFVGFNSRVAALDRNTGDIVWSWKAPKGTGFVAVLLDTDRLIASVDGYTYCLDPRTGSTMWENHLKGLGTGVPCLASVAGQSSYPILAEAQKEQQRSAANAGT